MDYIDLNKACRKDNFSMSNIHIHIDNSSKYEIQSFVHFYAGDHQIPMDEEDEEKTGFIMPWGVYHYGVMSFGIKKFVATYMRAMKIIFHDMINKKI